MNLCSNVPSNLRPGKNLIMLYKQLVILYKPPFDKYLICLKDINEMFYQILITEFVLNSLNPEIIPILYVFRYSF